MTLDRACARPFAREIFDGGDSPRRWRNEARPPWLRLAHALVDVTDPQAVRALHKVEVQTYKRVGQANRAGIGVLRSIRVDTQLMKATEVREVRHLEGDRLDIELLAFGLLEVRFTSATVQAPSFVVVDSIIGK